MWEKMAADPHSTADTQVNHVSFLCPRASAAARSVAGSNTLIVCERERTKEIASTTVTKTYHALHHCSP